MKSLKELTTTVFENKHEIANHLDKENGYRVQVEDDRKVLISLDSSKALGRDLAMFEMKIIIINGGIWQYRFYNPAVSDDDIYFDARQFLFHIVDMMNL